MSLCRCLWCNFGVIYVLRQANTEPDAQSGSWIRKGLDTWNLWSTLEYNTETVIAIWTLTQPLTCKMGSYIFADMSQIKVASMNWASLNIIPSTKITNRENVSVRCDNTARACPYWFFRLTQKLIHSLWLTSLHISISKPDVNDCFYLAIP